MSEDIRSKLEVRSSLLLKQSAVTIQMLPSLKRALYTFDNTIANQIDELLTSWEHFVPLPPAEVTNFQANDNQGTLQTRASADGKHNTKLFIDFRNPIPKGHDYTFTFQYQTGLTTITSSKILTNLVAYSDWLTYAIPCKQLSVTIKLPEKTSLKMSVPPLDINSPPYVHRKTDFQPLDILTFMLVIRKHKIGRPFWLWLAGALGSGIIGVLISQLLT